MKVRILYFAAVRDLTGRDEEIADLPPSVRDVGSLRAWLEVSRPELAGRLAPVRFARNEAFAANDEPLADGDTIALIPPVAGG